MLFVYIVQSHFYINSERMSQKNRPKRLNLVRNGIVPKPAQKDSV